ncbi:MAG: hypothetical protein EPO07_17860 [Verrucomicrobia bacterium]|nr:MAG: hypothetical protein EPO07_17860 [Verrucomicrobiota bacterium]
MKLLPAALLAIVVVATGCSSAMCGRKQTVPVTSKPTGAAVTVYDRFNEVVFRGTTPCCVTLDRGTEDHSAAAYRVTVTKEGFATDEVFLKGKTNRAYLLNALNGVGLVADPLTGAMWTLSPTEVETVFH